jgi:hypothetical protein
MPEQVYTVANQNDSVFIASRMSMSWVLAALLNAKQQKRPFIENSLSALKRRRSVFVFFQARSHPSRE